MEKDRLEMKIIDTIGIQITTQEYNLKLIASPGLDKEGILNGCISSVDDDGNNLIDSNKISDGYHTFGELYEHRIQLFISLCRIISHSSAYIQGLLHKPLDSDKCPWMSLLHSDGTAYEGWFILGIGIEKGKQITYHLPMSKWEECEKFAKKLIKAPDWDGHTSSDVLARLKGILLHTF